MDQLFRGAPNSPVSLLNKASICSTGLTPKVSENLSSTTFTINKDNSLTLTPVPIPPAANRAYYDEPRYHRVEFTPRSTPGLEYGNGTQGSESVVGDARHDEETHQWREPDAQKVVEGYEGNVCEERHVVDGRDERHVVEGREDEKEKDGSGSVVGGKSNRGSGYQVFVPKPHKSYEEYMPNINAYTEPGRADSRCSLKSPSSFLDAVPADRSKPNVVIQERSLPVRALIDSFEHNGRPVMRYLQLEESIPLSDGIRHLHDDPPPPQQQQPLATTVADGQDAGGFYTADAVVETRSFVYGTTADGHSNSRPQPEQPVEPVDEQQQAYAEGSGATDRSEYGDTDEASMPPFDVRSDLKFQTIRQLATPDSLESSMLFAHKHTSSERDHAATAYYGAPPPQAPPQTRVTGKTSASQRLVFSCRFSLCSCSSSSPFSIVIVSLRARPAFTITWASRVGTASWLTSRLPRLCARNRYTNQ